MCEILVKARAEFINPNPMLDRRGVYKRGDLVLGFDTPHEWGSEETLPKFIVWSIPDMTLQEFIDWSMATYGCEPFASQYTPETKEDSEPIVLTRRRIYIDEDSLPLMHRQTYQVGTLALPPSPVWLKDKESL